MILGKLALWLCLPKDTGTCANELVVEVALMVGAFPAPSVQGIECCAAEVYALETFGDIVTGRIGYGSIGCRDERCLDGIA